MTTSSCDPKAITSEDSSRELRALTMWEIKV